MYASTNYTCYTSSSSFNRPYKLINFQKQYPKKAVQVSGYSSRKKTEPLTYQSCIYNQPRMKNPFFRPSLNHYSQIQPVISRKYYSSIQTYEPEIQCYSSRELKNYSLDYDEEVLEAHKNMREREAERIFQAIINKEINQSKQKKSHPKMKKETSNHWSQSNYEEQYDGISMRKAFTQYQGPKRNNLGYFPKHSKHQSEKYEFEEDQSFRNQDSPRFHQQELETVDAPSSIEHHGRKFYFVPLK